jgi:phosphoribosylcarboxyaminoimidazole (NCAIR) mutase
VACVAVNGARNAAILAARIIENGGSAPPPRGRPTAEL